MIPECIPQTNMDRRCISSFQSRLYPFPPQSLSSQTSILSAMSSTPRLCYPDRCSISSPCILALICLPLDPICRYQNLGTIRNVLSHGLQRGLCCQVAIPTYLHRILELSNRCAVIMQGNNEMEQSILSKRMMGW